MHVIVVAYHHPCMNLTIFWHLSPYLQHKKVFTLVSFVIIMQTSSYEPHPLLLGAPLFYEMWNANAQVENGFKQISLVLGEVTKILLLSDHTHKGKELFHVKTKESNCVT